MWISIIQLTSQWGTALRVFVHANPNNSKWGVSKDFDRFRQKPRRCENTAELVCQTVERVWSNCITKVLNERRFWNKGNITPRFFFFFFQLRSYPLIFSFILSTSIAFLSAFEFRSIDIGSRKPIGRNSHLCLSWDLIGSESWKKVRHFLHMKTIPFFTTKQTAGSVCFWENLRWCLLRKGQGFAQSTTGNLRHVPRTCGAVVWVRNSSDRLSNR